MDYFEEDEHYEYDCRCGESFKVFKDALCNFSDESFALECENCSSWISVDYTENKSS